MMVSIKISKDTFYRLIVPLAEQMRGNRQAGNELYNAVRKVQNDLKKVSYESSSTLGFSG